MRSSLSGPGSGPLRTPSFGVRNRRPAEDRRDVLGVTSKCCPWLVYEQTKDCTADVFDHSHIG